MMIVLKARGPAGSRILALGLLMLLATLLMAAGMSVVGATRPADAATTFTVNKTGDAGDRKITDTVCDTSRKRGKQCTLRAAIQEANDTLGADTINFNIGGTNSVKTISPASPLPEITDSVTINGYTQRGSRANTLARGNDAVLKVQLNGTNAGTEASPNPSGLGIRADALNSTIKGLVINRFDNAGVFILGSGATDNKVEGNFIGTNASGTQALPNGFAGVFIGSASNNTVGGTSPAARNVISGNKTHGVLISGLVGSATANKVEGNYIGTTANGSAALGNDERGVSIQQNANSNIIGGTADGAGNVISGNRVSGVAIFGSAGNKVEGNSIGTAASGVPLGNGGEGVSIGAASNNTIGGTDADDGTVDGVVRARNTIAFNGADGVTVSSGTGNRILSNQIFGNGPVHPNGAVGIDLHGNNNVTPNDPDDPDTGPNRLQNFPLITSATRDSTTGITTITGTLNSNPSQSYTIQCFKADGDGTNHGEGQIFVGETTTTTNTEGDSPTFTCTSDFLEVNQQVTATATNTTSGDTSEFSLNVVVN